ncbi:FCD domain-containing protein [Streptomyces sp. FIT100]|uniref:FCD domain-containing protein n=1 Tax=Streptomyces sp. FIT100 TaxID=2837956 RepID=UPI0021C9E569|nr:FCD domain-containing protein [Streptomyces sp. FIT100]UUN30701.1 FCD domain-containing protein [Streptomyces sp. FIT100]
MTVPDAPSFPPLTEADRATLLGWSAEPTGPLRTRSRIVLACADGLANAAVAKRLKVSPATVAKWRERYLRRGLEGLSDAPRPGRPRSAVREEAERSVAAALEAVRSGGPAPSTRSLSEALGLSQSTVARIWQQQERESPGRQVSDGVVRGRQARTPDRQAAPGLLPRQLLSDHVYSLLRRWIVSGELVPGQRLVESEIARRLGTSQAPAREALKRLAHEGLVNSLPHRGTFVAAVSEQQAQEVRDIRVMFEEYAARHATGRLAPEALRLLTADVDAMRRAAESGDIGDFRDADMSFHRNVCAACGNSALIRLWRTIEPSMWGLHVLGNPLYRGDWRAMAEHHAELLSALRSGEPDETAALFAAHAAGEASRYRRELNTPATPFEP